MRIVIAKTAGSGSDFENYNTESDPMARHMTGFTEQSYGLKVEFDNGEYRLFPWTSIRFLDVYNS